MMLFTSWLPVPSRIRHTTCAGGSAIQTEYSVTDNDLSESGPTKSLTGYGNCHLGERWSRSYSTTLDCDLRWIRLWGRYTVAAGLTPREPASLSYRCQMRSATWKAHSDGATNSWTRFLQHQRSSYLSPPEESKQACLRYRYRLPKVVGDRDHQQAAAQFRASEEPLGAARETLEQVLALMFPNPVAIAGRLNLEAEWSLHAGGVSFQPYSLTRLQRSRRLDLDGPAATEIVETWRQLRQPRLLQRQKALALGLRRLNYQAGRERVEDELVDILIAAEALYLSDVGFDELGFRMALRAAALCDPQKLGMTRRHVFDLMRWAYRVRGKIVHGDEPDPKDLKLKGAHVPLTDFVQAIEDVVRGGLREALGRAADPRDVWPPDWDAMTLPS